MRQGKLARIWRRTSNKTSAAATETLSEAVVPYIGIRITRSHRSRTSRDNPRPSPPTARATGDVHPTITKRTMKNVKSGHRTETTFTGVAYDVGLDDGVFTERSLQSPPQQWIR